MKFEKKHNVNVKINPELWRQARARAIYAGDLTAPQIVEAALRVWLKTLEDSE